MRDAIGHHRRTAPSRAHHENRSKHGILQQIDRLRGFAHQPPECASSRKRRSETAPEQDRYRASAVFHTCPKQRDTQTKHVLAMRSLHSCSTTCPDEPMCPGDFVSGANLNHSTGRFHPEIELSGSTDAKMNQLPRTVQDDHGCDAGASRSHAARAGAFGSKPSRPRRHRQRVWASGSRSPRFMLITTGDFPSVLECCP